MRISTFLLLLGILQAQANDVYSQKTRISLNIYETKLNTVLDKIEKESEFYFLYNEKLLDVDRMVSVKAKDELLSVILDNLFAGTDVKYTIIDRKIILAPGYLTGINNLQNKIINGTVVDATNGDGLPGVNIVLEGTTIGTVTDANGNYSIEVSKDNAILIFTFIGYNSERISVNGKSSIEVKLIPDITKLDEVVVIGYGSVKKSDVTGSVSQVKTESLKGTKFNSMEQILQGRAAGVQVTQTSNAPGGGISIKVRGTSSINGGSQPLFVIDGVPINNNDGQLYGRNTFDGGVSPTNALSLINPNDIESMEVLKDASATAIYGARGANGVVLITTKKGTPGKSKVTLDASYGWQKITKTMNIMNARQYAEYNTIALANNQSNGMDAPLPPVYDLNNLNKEYTDLNRTFKLSDVDYQKEMFRVAPTQNYQFSASGGDNSVTYMLSLGYMDQQGIIKNSGQKRYSIRLNLDKKLTKWWKVGENFSFSKMSNNIQVTDDWYERNVVTSALRMPPTIPITIGFGDYTNGSEVAGAGLAQNTIGGNPLYRINMAENRQTANKILGNIFSEITIAKGLLFRTSFAADISDGRQYFKEPVNGQIRPTLVGVLNATNSNYMMIENTLNYNKEVGKHSFSALIGTTAEKFFWENIGIRGESMSGITGYYDDMAGNTMKSMTQVSNTDEWSMASFIGRANYSYASRYLLTASIRADGSSKFGKNNKFGYFPSAAFAWVVSKEEFMKNVSTISNLKLRLSYGQTGNQDIGNYNSIPTLGGIRIVAPTIAATPEWGKAPDKIANPDLKWETSISKNAGIDISVLRDRISLTADYYIKTTNDMLFWVPITTTSGYWNALKNIGKVENKGFEFGLNTVNLSSKDYSWSTAFNVSFNKNKLLVIDGKQTEVKDVGAGGMQILKVGEALGSFYGYTLDGCIKTGDTHTTQPDAQVGDNKFLDINGPDGKPDGIIDGWDRSILGQADPSFIYSLTNNFTFKGFDLNIYLQGVSGNKIMNFTRANILETTDGRTNASVDVLNNSFKPGVNENTDIRMIRQNSKSSGYGSSVNTRYLEDGSYLRIKNVVLGYTLPSGLVKKVGVSSLRIYGSITNLATFTNYSGYNPDVNSNGKSSAGGGYGYEFGPYPAARTYSIGATLSF